MAAVRAPKAKARARVAEPKARANAPKAKANAPKAKANAPKAGTKSTGAPTPKPKNGRVGPIGRAKANIKSSFSRARSKISSSRPARYARTAINRYKKTKKIRIN